MNSTTETLYKMRVAVKKVQYMFEAWPATVKLHHLLCEFVFTKYSCHFIFIYIGRLLSS